MALTEQATGDQAATLDTEHDLSTQITDDGYFQLRVDANAMVNGDILVLRWYSVTRSGGTERKEGRAVFAHVQENPSLLTPPIPNLYGLQFTLEQTDGTGRTYPWTIMKSA